GGAAGAARRGGRALVRGDQGEKPDRDRDRQALVQRRYRAAAGPGRARLRGGRALLRHRGVEGGRPRLPRETPAALSVDQTDAWGGRPVALSIVTLRGCRDRIELPAVREFQFGEPSPQISMPARGRDRHFADAEGATAPESLRQMNHAMADKTLESGAYTPADGIPFSGKETEGALERSAQRPHLRVLQCPQLSNPHQMPD